MAALTIQTVYMNIQVYAATDKWNQATGSCICDFLHSSPKNESFISVLMY